MDRGAVIILQSRNLPLSGTALCCTVSVLPRQTPQRPRRDFILGGRGGFTPCRASFPLAATDLHTPSKARIDHVAHVCLSYPSGKPVRPRLVSL